MRNGSARVNSNFCGSSHFWGIDAACGIEQTLKRSRVAGYESWLLEMSANNTPGWGAPGLGQRIEEAVELIEMELRHAIAYVNDAVIPQVRRESISAMRTAADTLRNLADRFEQRSNAAAGYPPNPPRNPAGQPSPSSAPPPNPSSPRSGEPRS